MSPLPQAPLLEVRGLTKRFQGLVSVDHVSFTISPGEILAIIGPNGAGKTTLVNMVGGTLAADEGTIRFEGVAIDRLSAFRRARLGIARTFQVMKPFPGMTALDNVSVGALFGSRGGQRSMAAARAEAGEMLTAVGISTRAHRNANTLGGPDLKRLELAKALAQRPKLLLLDEVMAGLNSAEVDEIVPVVRRVRERGIGIVIVEHVMKAVRSLADRVIVLHHGQQIAEGDPASVFATPRVIEAYLGKRRG